MALNSISSCRDAGHPLSFGLVLPSAAELPFDGVSAPYGVSQGVSNLFGASLPGSSDGVDASTRAVPQMPQKDSLFEKKALPHTEQASPLSTGGSLFCHAGAPAGARSDSASRCPVDVSVPSLSS